MRLLPWLADVLLASAPVRRVIFVFSHFLCAFRLHRSEPIQALQLFPCASVASGVACIHASREHAWPASEAASDESLQSDGPPENQMACCHQTSPPHSPQSENFARRTGGIVEDHKAPDSLGILSCAKRH